MKKLLFTWLMCFCALSLNAKELRVLLADGLKKAQVQNSGLVYIYEEGGKKYKVSAAETLNISLNGKTLSLGALKTQKPLIIEPTKGVKLTFQKNTYTGKFYIVIKDNTFRLVEHTDIEDYLLGVLPYEMSYSWPVEALKAQAVSARTYTLMQLKNKKRTDFDLYNDTRDQMYKGSGKVYDSVREAVQGTQGQVLTYKGNPFHTYYHANCGGGTDDAKIWTGAKGPTIKPLQGHSCAYDKHSKSYTWANTVPQKSINKFVNKNGLQGSVSKIKVADKSASKRAITLEFTTNKGKKELSCAKFRLAVGASLLKSCKLTDIKKNNRGFAFNGHGYGHGIGMCQDGAKGMALAGKNYKQILSNYFPSAELTEL